MMAQLQKLMFQFHNGTINTAEEAQKSRDFQCFNSTTVQLIHRDRIK